MSSQGRYTRPALTPGARLTQALDGIAEPRRLLEALFETAPTAFQIFDAHGRSLACNQAFRELFGAEPPPDYNILQDDIAQRLGLIEQVQRAFAGETTHAPAFWYDPRELRSVSVSEGRRCAIEVTLIALHDESGRVQYVAQCCNDVTARELLRIE